MVDDIKRQVQAEPTRRLRILEGRPWTMRQDGSIASDAHVHGGRRPFGVPSTDYDMARYLVEKYQPKSVLDLGCGVGALLKHFIDFGVAAVGCDGRSDYIAAVCDEAFAFRYDLCSPLQINKTFSLVTCVSVAEHLPERCAATLVESATRHDHSNILLVSPPDAIGKSPELNCQPKEYWEMRFRKFGWELSPDETDLLRDFAIKKGAAHDWRVGGYVFSRSVRRRII